MQNPGQIWIFYKAGQMSTTHLTQAKCDLVDPNDPDNLTWLKHLLWEGPLFLKLGKED